MARTRRTIVGVALASVATSTLIAAAAPSGSLDAAEQAHGVGGVSTASSWSPLVAK